MQIDSNRLASLTFPNLKVSHLFVMCKIFEIQNFDSSRWITMRQLAAAHGVDCSCSATLSVDDAKIMSSLKRIIRLLEDGMIVTCVSRYKLMKEMNYEFDRDKHIYSRKFYQLSNDGFLYVTSLRTFND